MASLNNMQIIGNLGADPEMRYTPGGAPVTTFSVAVSERFRRQDGTEAEDTQWFRCEVWNKLAENCNQYLAKGRRVYVQGKVRLETFQKNDGTMGASLRLRAFSVLFLSDANQGGQPAEPGPVRAPAAAAGAPAPVHQCPRPAPQTCQRPPWATLWAPVSARTTRLPTLPRTTYPSSHGTCAQQKRWGT